MARPAVAPLLEDPARTGLFLDFDGTLSDIVQLPSEARPLEGVAETLSVLAKRFRLVAVVSGRSAAQLVEWLGPEVEIWGTHGAERAIGGEVSLADHAKGFEELMRRVHREASTAMERLGLEGTVLEDKGVMLGLHFRAATDRERARIELDRLADQLASRHGLRRAEGRLAYELRPPADFTKAAVVLERAREEQLKAAAYMGDDGVDLPGFDALDELAEEGVATARIAVRSDEAPPELLDRADVVVEGPAGALELLRELAGNDGGG